MGITYEKALLMVAEELGKHTNQQIAKVNAVHRKMEQEIAELKKQVRTLKAMKNLSTNKP